MNIFLPLVVYCGLLLGQNDHQADTLLYRGFRKIVCINAPLDPTAYHLTAGEIDDINYATVSYTHLTLPTKRIV